MTPFTDPEPKYDLFRCTGCQFKTTELKDCELETDGDWESGYFEYPVCPKCNCVIEGDYTQATMKKWLKWGLRQNDRRRGTVFDFLGEEVMIQLEVD